MTDAEYPDNPDISIRHPRDGAFGHSEVQFCPVDSLKGIYNIRILPDSSNSATIELLNINLLEMIPTVPTYITDNEYMAEIAVINQQFNRVQVSFKKGVPELRVDSTSEEGQLITKVDIAKNCLYAGLWEVFTFAKHDGSDRPMYHGWFEFPLELYAKLFVQRNGEKYLDGYKKYLLSLASWVNVKSEKIDLRALRRVSETNSVTVQSFNDVIYPMKGDRKKKKKNIIYPTDPTSMQDFLTDATLFANFLPPGVYDRRDPRKGEYSRFQKVAPTGFLRKTISNNNQHDACSEVELRFENPKGVQTKLVLGGLNLDKIPAKPDSLVNDAYQMPLGIANYSFGQSYSDLLKVSSKDNPYFGMLLDAKDTWLNNHDVGIDGVMLHKGEGADADKLHIWLLSFERHALVGHYVIKI